MALVDKEPGLRGADRTSRRRTRRALSLQDAVAAAEANVRSGALRTGEKKTALFVGPGDTKPLSPHVVSVLTEDAVAGPGGFLDLDKPPTVLSEEEAERLRRQRIRRRVIAATEATAVAAVAVAGLAFVIDDHAHEANLLNGDHSQPGDNGHIIIDGLDYGNMIFAEDLQGHELPPALQHQIEAALIPVQIHAGPNQPLSHHEITGVVIQGTDGNPYIVTLNPAQDEYKYYLDRDGDGKWDIINPDFQGKDQNSVAVIPTDSGDSSSMLSLAEEDLSASTEVLHLVTMDDGKVTFTEILVGSDEAGNPILFAPPQEHLSKGETATEDLFSPAVHGGLVVNNKGQVLGFLGNVDRVHWVVDGTDPSNPELVWGLTGTLQPIKPIHPSGLPKDVL